ncbi:fuconate dehydratase [Alloacidobacterium dinghuense]|uniref:L-fuconate dehydratase n=1 Tax=Alloacidobacterium dinghuense TaxID=2763107 RepID=A0A7G8BE40_9BACT|nr:enolase C-terminal domain-like protein [Alloacidobacterium dinghuense]QNI30810.1 fuconate dehydratase [Alloacidobacterium dinghuense]
MSDLKITHARVVDLRFPTSREHIGSDAVNVDPDYSAAYCILETDHGPHGYGLTFTLGRGTELCVEALKYLSRFAVGRTLSSITDDLGEFYRLLTSDSQFRWLGPEKGVIHLATGALINAVWDLYARVQEKPLWKLLADMSAEEIVRAIDFRYITDALTREEALEILRARKACMDTRLKQLQETGYPAYTTSAGWFGYDDEKIVRLASEGLAEGWTHFKLKVGGKPDDDLRRARLLRNTIGCGNKLMMDANQKWDIGEAIERTRQLAEVDPWWMEEPTNPDDILGHARIRREVPKVRIATGEHCHNRVMFKQLMQAEAIDVCQIDSCRLAGVNENLAVILMAAKFDLPVCPHAGGVGLCEYVQHLSAFDFLRVSTTLEDRVTEFVDHLHEHFVDPVKIRNAHYVLPEKPGYSAEIYEDTLHDYSYPDGRFWRNE